MAKQKIPCGGYYYDDTQIQFEKTPEGYPIIKINPSEIQTPQATETEFGTVKKMRNVQNVSAKDATASGETYDRTKIDDIVNLANGCKGTVNAILKALKDAGIMA